MGELVDTVGGWLGTAAEAATKYAPLVKTGVAALSTYASWKDQQKKNQMQQDAYDDYMAQASAAGHEAAAAVDLNLTPMTVSGVPQTKADVTDFTAVAAGGGLMSIPNKQRKRYALGTPDEFEVETMDEEVLSPFDLQQETGLDLSGEQVNVPADIEKIIMEKWIERGGSWGDSIPQEFKDEIIRIYNLQASHPVNDQILENLYDENYDRLKGLGHSDDKIHEIIMDMFYDMPGGPEGRAPVEETGIMQAAKGGRIRKDNGGIMDLGGMEKDYRTTGGFVPLGEYERKDDVPARLSKNEFVMTADAVRAAGGGSINRGAQRMYDTMKHLEAKPQSRRMTV